MDRREIIKSLFTPELLREHPKFKVLVEAVSEELGRTSDSIQLLPILGSPELIPARYLPLMCNQFGIECDYDKTAEAHREIVKRIFEARKLRGTNDSILRSLRRAVDTNFYIEDLTYYNRKLQEQDALIYPAHTRIFRASVSKASGNHHLENGVTWDMGVLIVEVEDWNSRVQEKVYKVLPAGRVVWCHLYVTLGGQEFEPDPYPSWDPSTGERTESEEWAGIGTQGSVLAPSGQAGDEEVLEIFMQTRAPVQGSMIFSVHGKLSGAEREKGSQYSLVPASGVLLKKNEFGVELQIRCPFITDRNGFADAGGSLGDGIVKVGIDGFVCGEDTYTEWNGAFMDDVDAGEFGSGRGSVFPYDGLAYKS